MTQFQHPPELDETVTPQREYRANVEDEEKPEEKQAVPNDVFGDEQDAEIKYKVLSWW
jgi:hypothetical protein